MTSTARGLVLAALFAVTSACGGGGTSAPAAPAPAPAAATPSPPTANVAATPPPSCLGDQTLPQLLDLVNAVRARGANCGSAGAFPSSSPLVLHGSMNQAAQAHSDDMAAKDYFAHAAPDGSRIGNRVTATGYEWTLVGENIAAGQTDMAAAIEAWVKSPGHCANLMDERFQHLGLACAVNDATAYKRYFTMTLGRQSP